MPGMEGLRVDSHNEGKFCKTLDGTRRNGTS